MSRFHFGSRLPTNGSDKGSYGGHIYSDTDRHPDRNQSPIVTQSPNHISEHYVIRTVEHVDAPVIVTEYEYITQKIVESSNPLHRRPQFNISQYRHPSTTKAESMEKHGFATDKLDYPSSTTRYHVHGTPIKVEPMKTYGILNDKWDKPSSPAHDYGHSSPAKVEPVKDYEVINKKWDKPLTTVLDLKYRSPITTEPTKNYGAINDKWDKPSTPVQDQRYSSPTKQDPGKNYGVINDKWDKPTIPVRDHKYIPPTKADEMKNHGVIDNKMGKGSNPARERPEKVDEFITNVQTVANPPTRPPILSGKNWRNIPKSREPGGANGYDEYFNSKNKDMDKPIIDTVRNERLEKPYVIGQNGWERPGQKEWTMPLNQGTPIFGPTNDIGEVVNILEEATNPTPQTQYNSNYPYSRGPKRDTYSGTIDSRQAQMKYGNQNPSARPTQMGETYMGTIDSEEAAQKYRGTRV